MGDLAGRLFVHVVEPVEQLAIEGDRFAVVVVVVRLLLWRRRRRRFVGGHSTRAGDRTGDGRKAQRRWGDAVFCGRNR